ncbi:hypothetical protein E4U41_000405 [Claviceps citrina]|nr:hypothetical protein E4U41_000405 [Claviceps citrina]
MAAATATAAATDNHKQRSVYILSLLVLKEGQDPRHVDWQRDGLLSVEAYQGSNAWHGRIPLRPHRDDWPRDGPQTDLSKFDELVKLLRPVPKHKIYPTFLPQELTRYEPEPSAGGGDDGSAVYFKAPKVAHYRGDGSDEIATRLLHEAKMLEVIRRDPHPNLGGYLGCVEEDGLLTRLVFKRYSKSVQDLLDDDVPEFTPQQRVECMDQVEAGAAHLHALGLAHNDISPSNIMFDGRDAVLIDFDCCAPFGSPLSKGGWVTGWKGPMDGEGQQFKESSAECDRLAIREIRKHLGVLGD